MVRAARVLFEKMIQQVLSGSLMSTISENGNQVDELLRRWADVVPIFSATNNPDRGATFRVLLPAVDSAGYEI